MNKATRQHLSAVVVLSAVIVLRWWPYVTAAGPRGDEAIYLAAFRAVAEGRSLAAVSGFYYPATFATLGSWLLHLLGEAGTLVLLRCGSVAGLVVTVWVSACMLSARQVGRLALGVAYVAVAPAVYYGIEIGNITFVVSGAVVLGLLAWPLYPVSAGALLGASTAIKPLAPLAILALVAHRPAASSHRNLVAGAVASVIAVALLATSPGYLAIPSEAIDRLPFIRSISLNRILVLLGLEVPPVVVAAVLAIVVAGVARWRPMDRREVLAYGGLAAVLAVPVIWSHTLVLTLPLQALAVAAALQRRRTIDHPSGRGDARHLWRRYEICFVLLAVAALQLTEGAGAIDDQALWFQLVVLIGAYAAAPALMAYVLVVGKRRPADGGAE